MHPSSSSSRSIPPRGSAVGRMGLTLGSGFWEGSPGPGAGEKGLSLSPRERLQGAGAVLPTQPGSARRQEESHLDVGSIRTHSKSRCARNLEAGAVSHKGSQGRKKEHPTKTRRKTCLDAALGVTGCRQPPEPPAWVGLYRERGASCCPSVLLSLLELSASPLPTAPAPVSPQAGLPRGPAPPGRGHGCGTGCRGEVSAWV